MEAKPPRANQLDLAKVTRQYKLELKSHELPQEMQARLEKERLEARNERIKDLILFVAVIIGVASVGGVCIWFVVGPSHSADDKKWAFSVLASIVSAGVGYLTGKGSK
jgi:hypothetical protein